MAERERSPSIGKDCALVWTAMGAVSVIASATAATAAGALFHVPACAYSPCFQLEISDAAVTVGNMA